jgi:hypothetical protein
MPDRLEFPNEFYPVALGNAPEQQPKLQMLASIVEQ